MKFLIGRTSDSGMLSEEPPAPGAVRSGASAWQIEIATLEDLNRLIDQLEEPLILSRRKGPSGITTIEIYDDMREENLS